MGHKIKKANYTIYTTSDFPYGVAAENFVRNLALGIKHNNKNVNVVLLRGHYQETNKENDTRIPVRNILFDNRPKKELTKLLELFLLIILIPFSLLKDKIKYNSNHIILYGVEYFYFIFPIWLTAKILKINIYRIVTDLYDDVSIAPSAFKKIKLIFYRLQHNYFDRFLDGIIFLSICLKKEAIKKGVKATRICLIPHIINTNKFNSLKKTKLNTENLRIGFFGTPVGQNGIFVLADAFLLVKEKYPNVKLLIVGGISEEDKKIIEKKNDTWKEDIFFTGKVTIDEIPELLSTCEILVNPRISGRFSDAGFPTKLGEYFASGIPVVSTSSKNLSYFLKDKEQLVLVKPDSAELLAEGITYLIKNPNERERIAKIGNKWAKINLDYRISTKEIIDFCEIKIK